MKDEESLEERANKMSWFIILFPFYFFLFAGGSAFFAQLLFDLIFH